MFGDEIIAPPVIFAVSGLLIVALWTELTTNKIPNWISVLGAISGIALAAEDQLFLTHTIGFMVGFTVGVVGFTYGFAGGGAAKLLMAVGAVAGPTAPIISTVIFLLVLGYMYTISRSGSSRERNKERPKSGSVKGSIIIACGTATGFVLLSKPWI